MAALAARQHEGGLRPAMTMNLKELAAELGLSQTTVSRALNGYPEVSEKTRRRVFAAAERCGYKPSAAARRLATGRAHALGIVFPADGAYALDPLFVEYFAGVAETCEAAGFDIVVCPTLVANELSVYRRLITDGTVDVAILSAPRLRDERLTLLREVGFPFVFHGRPPEPEGCHFIDIDNFGAFRDAAAYLIGLGHRRIALLNGDDRLTYAADRENGVRMAFAMAGLPLSGLMVRSMPVAVADVHHVARDILAVPEPPTALLCSSVIMANGALRAADERGLKVPRDLSVIAHDDEMPAFCVDHIQPTLTTTSSSLRAAGVRVAEIAIGLLAAPPPAPLHEVWPVPLVVRGSTAPPPR